MVHLAWILEAITPLDAIPCQFAAKFFLLFFYARMCSNDASRRGCREWMGRMSACRTIDVVINRCGNVDANHRIVCLSNHFMHHHALLCLYRLICCFPHLHTSANRRVVLKESTAGSSLHTLSFFGEVKLTRPDFPPSIFYNDFTKQKTFDRFTRGSGTHIQQQ